MIRMMCYTWYVFVVALKVKKASSAQNTGGLPTKCIFIYYTRYHVYLNAPDQEQRFENHAWKCLMPGDAFDLLYVYVIPGA